MIHPDLHFMNPLRSTPEGIVLVGADLTPESLTFAYRQGVFPWPISDLPMTWFCPPERAILESSALHVGRSLKKAKKRSLFRFTIDQAFAEVIRECARVPRPGQDGTWITEEIVAAYIEFHRAGHAHSIEAWQGDQLVGGLYGVDAGGVFAAESMFHKVSEASKLTVLYLMDHLQSRGMDWLDIQVLTPHLEKLGAREIPRAVFLEKLAQGLAFHSRLF